VIGFTRDLGRFTMQRIACKARHAEQAGQGFLGALLGPVKRRALRVGVNDDDALAVARPRAGEMQRQGRLADATLLVEERDDHAAPPQPRMQTPRRAWRDASSANPDLQKCLLRLRAGERIRWVAGAVVHARRCRSTTLHSLLAKLESPNCCCAGKGKPDFGSR
jgi:hypothetical protein